MCRQSCPGASLAFGIAFCLSGFLLIGSVREYQQLHPPVPPGQVDLVVAGHDGYYAVPTTQAHLIVDLNPRDMHGNAMDDLGVDVTYTLNPSKVAAFYEATNDLCGTNSFGDCKVELGHQILKDSVVPYAVQSATEKSDLKTIALHPDIYASDIRAAIQSRLDKLYPGINPFVIQGVKFSTFRLPSSA